MHAFALVSITYASFSNVWCEYILCFILCCCSQFGDIYQEEYFLNLLKDDVSIVKELPSHMQSLDFKAVGSLVSSFSCCLLIHSLNCEIGMQNSDANLTPLLFAQITDSDIMKESKPIHFVNSVLPLLLRNGVVHLLGFGNRLGFDPMPFKLQVVDFIFGMGCHGRFQYG